MRILAGMSGGVDSTVLVCLLREQGHEVLGCTLALTDAFSPDGAAALAATLGVPHSVVRGKDTFKQNVTDIFAADYARGLTPNPCVLCNASVKLPLLLDEARRLGCDAAATGHYARVRYDAPSGRWLLLRGADRTKDQSYMLCRLTQDVLSRTLFPLGDLTKAEIRAYAHDAGLPNADQKDSQDICFVPDGDFASYLERAYGFVPTPGAFCDVQGNVLGTHTGAYRYTVGQRRGFNVGFGKRLYVLGTDTEKNTVTLADDDHLYQKTAHARDMNYIAVDGLTHDLHVTARVRYSPKEVRAVVHPTSPTEADVTFDEPVRAVTPGQSLVLYDGDTVVGGGILTKEAVV